MSAHWNYFATNERLPTTTSTPLSTLLSVSASMTASVSASVSVSSSMTIEAPSTLDLFITQHQQSNIPPQEFIDGRTFRNSLCVQISVMIGDDVHKLNWWLIEVDGEESDHSVKIFCTTSETAFQIRRRLQSLAL